ncbi:hypothetical protein B296_00032223 [Ensete ventricosum]|uniref:RRM domain-containing protein n=1 Tax=Ensete ventricosum TaxID=4639 RepID=A0A427A0T5_ENSVE|nr:hypothetical protein B296_00032223 [Ensete ventricosum]
MQLVFLTFRLREEGRSKRRVMKVEGGAESFAGRDGASCGFHRRRRRSKKERRSCSCHSNQKLRCVWELVEGQDTADADADEDTEKLVKIPVMARLYVGNLDPRTTARELEDEFRVFGVLRSVWVARKPPGFAFIDFDDRRDAQDAIRDLDGMYHCLSFTDFPLVLSLLASMDGELSCPITLAAAVVVTVMEVQI